jgi:hypothetical protein
MSGYLLCRVRAPVRPARTIPGTRRRKRRQPMAEWRHGRSNKKGNEYISWLCMKQRCLNPKDPRYKDYGGRGITIYEPWLDFVNFERDMGARPKGTSLDRWPNPNGNYEPGNCRWASRQQQQRNMRNSHFITWKGQRKLCREWAIELGLNYEVLRCRLRRHWPLERAMTEGIHMYEDPGGRAAYRRSPSK